MENPGSGRTNCCRVRRRPRRGECSPLPPRAIAVRHCRDRKAEARLPRASRWRLRLQLLLDQAIRRKCRAVRCAAARQPSNRKCASASSRDTRKQAGLYLRRSLASRQRRRHLPRYKRDDGPRIARLRIVLRRPLRSPQRAAAAERRTRQDVASAKYICGSPGFITVMLEKVAPPAELTNQNQISGRQSV